MAQQSFASIAVLIALTFAIMALHGCASSEQQTAAYGPAVIAPLEPEMTTPEFHGASIGRDALRSRLSTDD